VTDNTFHTNRNTAITVSNSPYVSIVGNEIHFNTRSGRNTCLKIEGIDAGFIIFNATPDTSGLIWANTFDTGGGGTGLSILRHGDHPLQLKVESNDFNANAVGVFIKGIGMHPDAGTIDLGGGSLGSQGHNDFRSYSGNDGRLAIVLEGTTDASHALGNYWSAVDPHSVIKDGHHQTRQPTLIPGADMVGTGVINVETNPLPDPASAIGGGGSDRLPSYPLGVWPDSWNVPGTAAAASHSHGQRMI
jgi:hypothetical protein